MMYSADRMNFIIDYISAYKQKIELANKKGLFDSAKMFELFAEEICKLYYDMDFHNLNKVCNFPYFDLISEDGKILVQVSTTTDVNSKIKSTLENIRDDKRHRFEKVDDVYFFVLHNDSVKNVKNYTGENKIGNISFTKEKNLITTEDIINKAQDNLIFQEKLYNLIKNEVENYNENLEKFEEAIYSSINIGISNIETKINNEYEIDRKELIKKVKEDNAKFISIQGTEGVGKTVICKKIIEKEDMVLYARAERFLEESHIDKIWNLNIKKILEYLNGRRITFFIDALEFIADAPKTKLDLLEALYSIVQNYENAYIITSCRTSDKNAFLKLEAKYNIMTYDICEINEEELNLLKIQYPIIKKMSEDEKYADLLKIPFYINIIIKNTIDIDEITDINKLREYIWTNIICLKDKPEKYNVKLNDVEDTVNKIVIDRAKKFALGVKECDIDYNIVSALKTEGIIIFNSEGIRLKYDIYEDICFENFFDNKFLECKGKYKIFFENIDKIGRCVYRRYQIWVANKLLVKYNRNKFIYNLIFNNEISDEWKKQTEIGIVKSDYSTMFFEENEEEISHKNLLNEFIDVINLYSYNAKMINCNKNPDIMLVPMGTGRGALINIIEKNNIYSKNIIDKSKIVKLCLDYTNQKKPNEEILKKSCKVMGYYIEKFIASNAFNLLDEIGDCLTVMFKLSNYCKEWLESFFAKIISYYNGNNKEEKRLAKIIIEFTTKNSWPNLVLNFPSKLCDMASLLWKEDREGKSFYIQEKNLYGLSDDYDYLYDSINDNVFLWNLFRNNFYFGIKWAINFVNECVKNYIQNCPQNVRKIKLIFIDENNLEREYYGNLDMWMGGTEEHYIHTLLSDIIYNIKEAVISYVDKNMNDENTIKFLEYVKGIIYRNSNNILLLTIIEHIGMHYKNEFPGYALDLISSIDIVKWDFSRFIMYVSNFQLNMLKKEILTEMGIPKLRERYKKDSKCGINIEQYVQNIQIVGTSKAKEKGYKILDYLYSAVNNDEENASKYLQIQKMDLRNAEITQLNNNIIGINSNITGEAKKIIEKDKEDNLLNDKTMLKLNEYIKKLNENTENTKLLISIIDEFIDLRNNDSSKLVGYESIIINLISKVLTKEDTPVNKKNFYCNYWINGIRSIFKNEIFVFEHILISKLIEQLNSNISIETKSSIKRIALDIINTNQKSGIINSIKKELVKYLQQNSKLSNMLFNTIIKLAEDKMKNNRNQIIEQYLYLEKELNIDMFCIDNYDLKSLCHIVSCGKSFEDDLFCKIVKEIIKVIIDIKNNDSKLYKNKTIDIYQEYEIIYWFEKELMYNEKEYKKIIDLLFDDMDFSKFKENVIEFYLEILNSFTAIYFDSYNNRNMRIIIEEKIKYIESKINNINLKDVREKLYKCLYLSPSKRARWNPYELKTKYEFRDKIFLNEQLKKYGKFDIKNSIRTIYLLKLDELLPEILIALERILDFNKDKLKSKSDRETREIIDKIIIKAFVCFCDEIKSDEDLIEAYEKVLKILIELNYEKAGVLLDEFRIH